MHNEDSVFAEIIVKDPEATEPSDRPEGETQPKVDVAEEIDASRNCTTADLVAIYSLIKAGYTAEDFQ